MALVYVPRGTTDLSTLTVSNGDSLIFGSGGQHVSSKLDEFAELTDGLNAVVGLADFTGRVGGNGSGSLEVDVDDGTDPVVRWSSPGELNIAAAGVDGEIERIVQTSGTVYVTGGEVGAVGVAGGRFVANTSTVIPTRLAVTMGRATVRHSATAIARVFVAGGRLDLERSVSELMEIGRGGVVIVGREDFELTPPTGATVVINGGRLEWRGGNITTLRIISGMVDLSKAPENLTITNLEISGSAQKASALDSIPATVTVTNTILLDASSTEIMTDGFGGEM